MPTVPYTAAYNDTARALSPIDLGNGTDRDFYTPIVGITNVTDTRQYIATASTAMVRPVVTAAR